MHTLVRRMSATENSISIPSRMMHADLNEVGKDDKGGHKVNDTIKHFLQQRQALAD